MFGLESVHLSMLSDSDLRRHQGLKSIFIIS